MSWSGAGHVVGQGFWFGSLLVLAGMLSPGAFGTVAIGLVLVTAATRLMEAGTRGTIIVARDFTRQQAMTALAQNLAVGAAMALVIGLMATPIAHTFAAGADAAVLLVLGLSVLVYAPAVVPLALLEKRMEFKRRATVQLTATVTAASLSVLAGALGLGVWALVIRQLVFQALLAALGWLAARRFLPAPDGRTGAPRWQRLTRRGAAGFLVFSLTDFLVFNADYLIVGHFTDATQLGLYSLAFTIAFAPVKQFSAVLGNVLFPAAAASDPETIRRRTVLGVRFTTLVLAPLVPAAVVLAPVLVPAVLGERWAGMVAPLQILVVVGVAHAIVNVIGESLSATGNIGFRARVNAIWMVGMLCALVPLVNAHGIRGAALAHAALYLPVALAYGLRGMRLLGAEPRRLRGALRGIGSILALQAAVTFGAVGLLVDAGAPAIAGGVTAAALGVAAGAALLASRGRLLAYDRGMFLMAGRRRR